MVAPPSTRSPSTEGLLLVDKPAGMTSHDVVAIARRALGERRIGHAGTLDPFATGLLVLLVGRFTRLLPYLDGEPKVYDARIRFGAETDTDDASGRLVREAPLPIRGDVDRGIASLTGTLDQEPSSYSARHLAGRRAYDAARQGTPLKLPPSRVTVHSWDVKARTKDALHAVITCSRGTYVRALARDLGRHAGSAAHLVGLRRTASGPFQVSDANGLDALRDGRYTLLSPMRALSSLAIEQLDALGAERAARGNLVDATVAGNRAVLLGPNGDLLAVAERAGSSWQPRTVLRDA